MPISIIDGLKITSAKPADLKSVLVSTASLYTSSLYSGGYISSSWRYVGMTVFCSDDASEYKLIGGIGDSNWVKITTGSLYVSSSWSGGQISSSYSTTSSYSATSSYVFNHVEKGIISGSSFTGSPKNVTIVFPNPFSNDMYIISVIGEDARIWSYNDKTPTSVIINSNSNQSLTGMMNYKIEGI